MNTMSLLRNSVIVGGATFLVGSAFMEIGKADSKSDIGKWPYIATFLSGALGFYLLKQNFIPVPKALELDAESLREEYERHWGEIDDEGAKGLIRCGGCDEATSYYDEMKFCEACQGRKKEGLMDAESFDADSLKGRWDEGTTRIVHGVSVTKSRYGDGEKPQYRASYNGYSCRIFYEGVAFYLPCWMYHGYGGVGRGGCFKNPMEAILDFKMRSEVSIPHKFDAEMAESSSSLQSFAAEVFEADRKIRRRTRWTWTRGMEDGFAFSSQLYKPHYHNDYEYKEDGAYHISDLPEGYHLHLYKPRRRSKKWIAYAKSPQSEDWEKFHSKNKSYLTPQLLEWYNLTIAKPTKQEMTPIMQMLIDTGSASGEVKISRVVIPEVPNMKKMPDGTKQKVGIITKEGIKFYGTKPNEKPKLLATQRNNEYDFSMSENGFESLGVLPFMQGLAFMGSQAGTTRSVNRYNKNREQWVKSYPAWFQNTVSNGIDTLEIKLNTNNRFKNILENGSNIDVVINRVTVATINRGERFYSRMKPYGGTEWITSFEQQNEPKIKVMGEEYPPIFILNKDGNFEQPRPSTQRKIYQNSMVLQDDGTYKVNSVKFIMEITDRYKFEKQKWLRESMINTGANLDKQSKLITSRYQPIMKTMLRRFKKNDK